MTGRAAMTSAARFVFTCWYGAALAERADPGLRSRIVLPLDDSWSRQLLTALRAWRRRDVLIASAGERITNLYLVLALLPGKRLVVLEVIEPEHVDSRLRAIQHAVRVAVLRRSGAHVQCATGQERDRLVGHGFAPERVHLLKWPDRMDDAATVPVPDKQDDLVVASGRRTDWATVFAAADGRGWRLTAICAGADLAEVRELARRHAPDAVVLSEIGLDEHHDWVARAAVYCIALPPDVTGSIGQVRLMNAATAGTAVVLTRLPALDDYLPAGGVRFVEPQRPDDLRSAVDELLADPGLRRRLAAELVAQASRTMGHHLDDIAALLTALDP